jgi:hypothetical protein
MASMRVTIQKPRKKVAKRQLELRDRLWPTIKEDALWSRQTYNGFTTLPRAMPLMISIMDDLAGQPVASTYLELWCRTFDESFVVLSKPREMAFHSGLTGQRAERQWKDKLKKLRDLGFIMLEEGPSGPFSYALILNPYQVIKNHHVVGTPGLRADKYNALLDRAIEIDDDSLAPPKPVVPPVPMNPAALAALGIPLIPGQPVPSIPPAAVPPPPLAQPTAQNSFGLVPPPPSADGSTS